MRNLRRPAVSLPTLTGEGKGARRAAENIKTWEAGSTVPFSFPDHWKEPDVRGALLAMHGRCCAFCQGNLPHNDLGDVEHFRPKATYWWLAYDFGNYLLSCRVCNSHCKGNKFPILQGAFPCTYLERHRLQDEKIVLLNPTLDDVEGWIRIRMEPPYLVEPAGLQIGTEEWQRVSETIDFFRLRKNRVLVQERREAVDGALDVLHEIRNGNLAKIARLKKMASRFRPHGIAVRQVLEELADDLLPSAEDDLRLLVHDFLELLKSVAQDLAQHPGDVLNFRQRAEILWALAVLWKDPPAGSPELIEDLLAESGWRDEVSALRQQA
jgi:uncharacterized protein (TIGR02646 family)